MPSEDYLEEKKDNVWRLDSSITRKLKDKKQKYAFANENNGVLIKNEEHLEANTIDKDLLMIPGEHYNFVKKEFQRVEYLQGLKHFYMQCLQGDRSDNIKGIPGIGPKKAESILSGCVTNQAMFNAVRYAYSNDEEFLMNGRVLWIRRNPDEDWKDIYNAIVQEQTGGASLEDTEGPISIDEV